MEYHIHNGDFMDFGGGDPEKAKRGNKFTLLKEVLGFTGPACRGTKTVPIPPGDYVIVSRKHFRGGTHTIRPA